MTYTYSGSASVASGTSAYTVNLGVGPTAGAFIVVAIHEDNGLLTGASTLTVGSTLVPLGKDIYDPDNQMALFSGVATGLTGTQPITLTLASAFDTVGFSLWYMPAATARNNTASSLTGGSASFTIPVNVGEYLFTIGEAGAAFTFNNSTVLPAENNVIPGDVNNGTSADWLIAATNASFSVAVAGATGARMVGATYVPPAAATFTTIGIGGSNW